MQKISNKNLTVLISEIGAELKSIRKNGKEYLYQGDKGWKRQAPVLFPWAGKLKNFTYTLDGETYKLGQHGFVKDMKFEILEKEEDRVLMALASNEETLTSFPREFVFKIEYSLQDDSLLVRVEIDNKSEREMPFGVGLHPGFINYDEESVFTLETGEADLIVVKGNGEMLPREKFLEKGFKLSDLQDNMTLLLSGVKGCRISSSDREMMIKSEGWDHYVFWRNESDPFFCPEVWANLPSMPDEKENFNTRTNIQRLAPRSTWNALCTYTLI